MNTDTMVLEREARPGRGWILAAIFPLLAVSLFLFIAYPLLDLLLKSLKVGDGYSLSRVTTLLIDGYTQRVVGNTLVLGVSVAVLGTLLATAYAYAMTRVAMPLKRSFHFLALLPTISPPILMALGLILLYGRRGFVTNGLFGMQTTELYGFWGLLVAQILSYFPFAYLLMRNMFQGLDASLEEAAGTMGAGAGRTLRTISLPLLAPGLASSALLLFGYSLADLGNPLLLGGDFPVLSAQIYLTVIGMYDIPKGAALAVILMVPVVMLYFVHKHLSDKMAVASVGGRGSSRHPLTRHKGIRAAAFGLCLLVSLIIIMQYATVLAGATTKLFGIDYSFTMRHFAAAFTSSRGALLDTIGLGIVASLVAAGVGMLTAYFVARSQMPGRGLLDFMANLPLAVPGTVIGLGFGLAFNERPLLLTGTALIIIIAFTVRSLPYTVRSAVAALGQLHRSLDEASTNMGATSGQTLWRVLVPLIRPAVLAGMVFTFTRSVTTLSAVIFVVSPHWSLVTPAILSQMDRGDVGEAAALSVVLVVLVLVVIHGVPRLMGRDWREDHAA